MKGPFLDCNVVAVFGNFDDVKFPKSLKYINSSRIKGATTILPVNVIEIVVFNKHPRNQYSSITPRGIPTRGFSRITKNGSMQHTEILRLSHVIVAEIFAR